MKAMAPFLVIRRTGSVHDLARHLFRTAILIVFACMTTFPVLGDDYSTKAPEKVLAEANRRLTQAYGEARQRYLQETNSGEAAWQFSRACYECADLATNSTQRTQHAQEGVDAAEKAIAINSRLAPGHYYLGLNQGQLARARPLGALGLIKQLERSWTNAVALDPAFDYAGSHRALGILYRDAPGRPLSLGDRRKAAQHLEKAVQLAPDYPDNFISLLESRLKWGQKETVRTNVPAMQKTLDAARARLTGEAWELSWHDWGHRWEKILAKTAMPAP